MAKANYYGLILAGGRGTRFWPRSRKRHAKQVLSVAPVGEENPRTLIQTTVDRLAPLIPPERIWILTNDFVRDEIVRQLPEVPAAQIIPEPAQRNTAPAIALAGHILQSIDPGAVCRRGAAGVSRGGEGFDRCPRNSAAVGGYGVWVYRVP